MNRFQNHSPAYQELFRSIEKILRTKAEGISEYDLIQKLQEDESSLLGQFSLRDTLSLFQLHFILFHALYLLKDQLRASRRGDLVISCMKIALVPLAAPASGTSIEEWDTLRDYYLNLDNLDNTGREEVEEMLHSFWKRFDLHNNRSRALEILGLKDPVNYDTIKRRYRELALELHPDRGGDKESLLAINEAMEILHKYYM